MKSYDLIYLPTAYLPPVQYIHYLYHSERACIEIHETYVKQTFRNRCEIYAANGKLSLSIPVIKIHGNHTKTMDILIDYQEDWQVNHWRAIVSAYNSSPFFLHYKEQFQDLYKQKHHQLIELNDKLLHLIMKILDIQTEIMYTDHYKKKIQGNIDFRYEISPKIRKTGLTFPEYQQVFREKYGFLANLSIIDLLFNEGPAAIDYIKSIEVR